jgi:hypothetical protein
MVNGRSRFEHTNSPDNISPRAVYIKRNIHMTMLLLTAKPAKRQHCNISMPRPNHNMLHVLVRKGHLKG